MLLGSYQLHKTKDEFLKELAALANAEDTLVYIDTNILSYLYKLHAAARNEFFAWVDSAVSNNRLYIPAWCAGEYLARVREGQLHSYTPKNKEEDQPRKALEAMLDTASLFVDERVLSASSFQGDRNEYLNGFRDAIDALKPFTRVFKHQFTPEAIHEEIERHLGGVVLDSPLAPLCDRASKEGPARVEHRLPPAFRDSSKPENRLGDLIIWFEIINHSAIVKSDFSNVLFLTNDEKTDWVYAPQKRFELVGGGRKSVPNINPSLRIIDPRLASEFRQVVGHDQITICSLAALVQGISKIDPASVGQLAAAIQIDLEVEADPESTATLPAAAPASPVLTDSCESSEPLHTVDVFTSVQAADSMIAEGVVQPAATPRQPDNDFSFEEDGYRDGAYEAEAPGDLNAVISALGSHNWYVQNPAIEKLKALRDKDFPPTAWFVLGRNIYQAACGNAQKAMDFMVNLDIQLKRFPADVASYLLAGMVFEIYFDSQGELRNTPKSGYFGKPLALLVDVAYSRVRKFIRSRLEGAGATLYFFPGESKMVDVVIETDAIDGGTVDADSEKMRKLCSVRMDGIDLLVSGEPPERSWARFNSTYSADELIENISSTFLVPRWAITRTFKPGVRPDSQFLIPEGKSLRSKLP